MKRSLDKRQQSLQAQSTVEYLLILGVVTAIVLVGFNGFITRSQEQANVFFNQAVSGIMGEAIDPGAADFRRTNYP